VIIFMLNFKVGDVVEQGDGTQWKIIGEHTNGLVWDVALVKKGPSIPLSVTIGSTVNYDKRLLTGTVVTLPPTNNNPLATFQIGDVVEFPGGNQWQIIGDSHNQMDWVIKLTKIGHDPETRKVGHIVFQDKKYFIIATLVQRINNTPMNFTFGISNSGITSDEVEEMRTAFYGQLSKCECGKEKHGFASHSTWCQKFEPMFL
jgi:hypothetical protein